MSLPTYEELLKRNRELLKDQKNKALGDSDKIYDTQITDVTGTYNKAIDQAKTEFEDEYQRNAVNRQILEKKIAEHNANLGLRDSGLNLTQQTALELSHNNQRGKIDLARKKTTDSLSQKLAEAVSTIQINKSAARGNIEQSYEQLAANNASSEYKANVEAETERQKALLKYQQEIQKSLIKASSKSTGSSTKTNLINTTNGLVSRNFTGSLSENGVTVTYNPSTGNYDYIDRITGKKTSFPKGVNPYKGTTHQNVKYGTYSNGYQPNNLGKDENGEIMKLKDSGMTDEMNGQIQRVFTYGGKYYIWDGSINDYRGYYPNTTKAKSSALTVKKMTK